MAMLWNGVAGVCRRLCRYLSLFRMSTSVHGKRLRGLATDHRPDSASSTAQTTQGLAVAVSAAASYRADAAARKWLAPGGGLFGAPTNRIDRSMHILA